ncbi:hypothetical protein [Nocardia vaccinii]|uniref:hypothetical protein n=1 Tax=Nocardia vaccinii TaxID=1822 RepID=UPI001FDF9EA3|nr:hypothetical protein [Nocardia vaccinii]
MADGAIWLASEESPHVIGLEMVIDAGHRVLPVVDFSPVIDDKPPGNQAVTFQDGTVHADRMR